MTSEGDLHKVKVIFPRDPDTWENMLPLIEKLDNLPGVSVEDLAPDVIANLTATMLIVDNDIPFEMPGCILRDVIICHGGRVQDSNAEISYLHMVGKSNWKVIGFDVFQSKYAIPWFHVNEFDGEDSVQLVQILYNLLLPAFQFLCDVASDDTFGPNGPTTKQLMEVIAGCCVVTNTAPEVCSYPRALYKCPFTESLRRHGWAGTILPDMPASSMTDQLLFEFDGIWG